jgi:hypothetical protein
MEGERRRDREGVAKEGERSGRGRSQEVLLYACMFS